MIGWNSRFFNEKPTQQIGEVIAGWDSFPYFIELWKVDMATLHLPDEVLLKCQLG
ncbi:MAG: hypothetical protein RL399_319 [Actinomycetota bacterium]